MQKVNQLYGKDVIHQGTGNRIATVRDIVLDAELHHIVALLVDERNLLNTSYVVRWSAVVSVGDVIIIDSVLPLAAVSEDAEVADLIGQANRITGTTIISDGGQQIGTIGDLFIDEQGTIVGYEVKRGFFTDLGGRKFMPVTNVQVIGADAVIATAAELETVKQAERAQDVPTMPAPQREPTDIG